jgi:hypothetical protein
MAVSDALTGYYVKAPRRNNLNNLKANAKCKVQNAKRKMSSLALAGFWADPPSICLLHFWLSSRKVGEEGR